MNNLKEFSAAIFDLDGVITHTASHHYKAWKKLANELHIPFTEQENEKLKGIDRMASLEHLLSLGKTSYSESEKQDMALRKNGYYTESITSLTKNDILPGVIELLNWLKTNNIKIGLASASKNAATILDALDITDRFDFIANPALARSKPAPDIFLFAAYGLGVRPETCVGFEDAIAGLQALKSASMYAISVGEDELSTYSDWHVQGLTECLPA